MNEDQLSYQPYLRWRLSKIRRRLIRKICGTFYRDANSEIGNSILVAGTGRSGTTWLADLIASQLSCRILFEPFLPDKASVYSHIPYMLYLRPGEEHADLQDYCHKLFEGSIKDPWIDRQIERLYPEYRLIKAIGINLSLRWIQEKFPRVRLLFIMRHPCAVVLSRMQLNWATDSDIEPFLRQPSLLNDFLSDKLDIINRATSPVEKHAVIWCINNMVPLRQFQSEPLHVVFYEHLCAQPNEVLSGVFKAIGHTYRNLSQDQIRKPSTTSIRSSAVVTGQNTIARWKGMLTTDQVQKILTIVQAFDLGHLYNDSVSPLIGIDEPFHMM